MGEEIRDGRVTLRERVVRRSRVIDQQLFFELGHDPSRSALVLGSGRGGTTWIAEQLARQTRSRMLFEPFHPYWTPFGNKVPLFLDPDRDDAAAREAVAKVLSGRVRKRELDQVRAARLPRNRVVKDIHTANLVPWYRAWFPDVPIIFVLRHPIATSLSRLRTGSFYGVGTYLEGSDGRRRAEESAVAPWLPIYDSYRLDEEPLVRGVAEWCLENAYPLSVISDDPGVALVYYERAVLDGVNELGRISVFCSGALRTARERELSTEELRRPSAMDWYGTAAAASKRQDWESRLARWSGEVSGDLAGRCMAVVEEFGINSAYSGGPLPAADGVRG